MKRYDATREILRLRRENRMLRRRLGEDVTFHAGRDEPSPEERLRLSAFRNEPYNSYFSYLVSRVTHSESWRLVNTVTRLSRRYLFLARTARMALYLWRIIDAGAALVVMVAVFAILLPVLLTAALATLIISLVSSRSANAKIKAELERDVTVFFAGDGQMQKNGFFAGTVREAAARGTVIVVSPHFFDPRGLGGRGYYVCTRREEPGVWLVRRSYYYYLRRTLLEGYAGKITYVR